MLVPTKFQGVSIEGAGKVVSDIKLQPLDSKRFAENFNLRNQECQKLFDAGDWAGLEAVVLQTVRELPVEQKGEKRELLKEVHLLNRFLFERYLAQHPKEASPEMVVAGAKLMILGHSISSRASQLIADPHISVLLDQTFGVSLLRITNPVLQADVAAIMRYSDAHCKGPPIIPVPDDTQLAEITGFNSIMFTNGRSIGFQGALHFFSVAGRVPWKLGNLFDSKSYSWAQTLLPRPPSPNRRGKRSFTAFQAKRIGFTSSFKVTMGGLNLEVKTYDPSGIHRRDFPNLLFFESGKPWKGSLLDRLNHRMGSQSEHTYSHGITAKPLPMDEKVARSERSVVKATVNQPLERSILLAQTYDGKVRAENMVLAFLSNTELFDHPEYVRLLEHDLFDQGVRADFSKWRPAEEILKRFVEVIQVEIRNGNIGRAATMLDQKRRMEGLLIPQLSKEDFAYYLGQIDLLASHASSMEEKRSVAFARLSLLADYRDYWLNDGASYEALEQVLADRAVIKSRSPGSSQRDSVIEHDIQMLVWWMGPRLRQVIAEEPGKGVELARGLLKQTGWPDSEAMITGTFPKYRVGSYHIDVVAGEVVSEKLMRTTLTEEIYTQLQGIPAAKALLESKNPGEPFAWGCTAQVAYDLVSKERVTVLVPDADPFMRILQRADQPLVIQRQFAEMGHKGLRKGWYELTELPTLSPPAISCLYGQSLWRNIDSPSHALTTKLGREEISYRVDFASDLLGHTVKDIRREADGLHLMTLDHKAADPVLFGQLLAVESPEYTLIWGEKGKPKEIQFPRLKTDGEALTYKFDKGDEKDGRISSLSGGPPIGGYRLAVRKPENNLLPVTFNQYQYLVKDKANDKIIVNLQELLPYDRLQDTDHQRKDEVAPWFNRAYFDRNVEDSGPQQFFTFDVDKQTQRIMSATPEGNLMLAYVFFAHKDYERAMEQLDKARTVVNMSQNYRQMMKWIQKWPDHTPEATVFKIRADLINLEQIHEEPDSSLTLKEEQEHLKRLSRLMARYEKHAHELPANLKLSDAEQELASAGVIDMATVMLGDSAAELSLSSARTLSEVQIAQLYMKLGSQQKLSKPAQLLENPDHLLSFCFVHLCETLRAGDDKAKVVEQQLRACVPRSSLGQGLRGYLLRAAQMGKWAPEFPAELKKKNSFLNNFALVKMFKMAKKHAVVANERSSLTEFFGQIKPPELSGGEKNSVGVFRKNLDQSVQHVRTAEQKLVSDLERANAFLKNTPVERSKPIECPPIKGHAVLKGPLVGRMQHVIAVTTEDPALRNHSDLDALKSKDGTPSSKRLADQLIEDTKYYRNKNPRAEGKILFPKEWPSIRTEAQQHLLHVRYGFIDSHGRRHQGRAEAEQTVLNILNTRPLKELPRIQHHTLLQAIPERLFGLYMNNEMDEMKVNQVFGTQFSPEECAILEKEVANYLELSIQERFAEGIWNKLETLPDDATKISSDTAKEVYALAHTQRYFDQSHPLARSLLVSEYYNGFILREEQVELLENLFSKPNGVCQLRPGGGKTIVAEPEFLYKSADGTHLAMAIIPEWLYKINVVELDRACRQLFGMKLIRFEFDRNSSVSVDDLRKQYAQLTTAIEQKQALLTTKTSLLSFRNKFLELEVALATASLRMNAMKS